MAGIDFKARAQAEKLVQVKRDLPIQLANMGQNFFSRAFQAAKWKDEPWKPRAHETKKTRGKHLLVATGKLRASIYHCIRRFSWSEVVWGTDVPYAKFHNEGTEGRPIRKHHREASNRQGEIFAKTITTGGGGIPKRQFMGDDPKMRADIHQKIRKEMGKVFHK